MFRASLVVSLVVSACLIDATVRAQAHHAGANPLQFNNPLAQANLYNNDPVLRFNNPLNQANLYNNDPVLQFNNPLNQANLYNNDPVLQFNNPLNQAGVGNSGFNNPLNQAGFGNSGFNNNGNANGFNAGNGFNGTTSRNRGRGRNGSPASHPLTSYAAENAQTRANMNAIANGYLLDSMGAMGIPRFTSNAMTNAALSGFGTPFFGGGVMAVSGGFGMNQGLLGGWGGGMNNPAGFGGWNGGGFNNGVMQNNLNGNGFNNNNNNMLGNADGAFGRNNVAGKNASNPGIVGAAKSDPFATSVLNGSTKAAKRTSKSSKTRKARHR